MHVSCVNGQSYAKAASTIGTSEATPSSSLNGWTLHVLPVDSKIKYSLPKTTHDYLITVYK